jgi:hypothetical protein
MLVQRIRYDGAHLAVRELGAVPGGEQLGDGEEFVGGPPSGVTTGDEKHVTPMEGKERGYIEGMVSV